MSKASEWVDASVKMRFWHDEELVAEVTKDGHLRMLGEQILSLGEIQDFRDWLSATFDEPKETP